MMIARTQRRRALACVCGLLVFTGWATASDALARTKPAGPIVLRHRFKRVGVGAYVLAAGAHVYLASSAGGTVIDDQTGQRTAFSHPYCGPFVFGGPWLLAECVPPASESVGLEQLTSGAWLTFTTAVGEHPVAAGADWIEFRRLGDPFTYTFENVRTGIVRTIPYRAGGSSIPDLNFPMLGRRLCSPLHVPSGPGAMTFYGKFAIVDSVGTDGGIRYYLERCGTRLHERLDGSNLGTPEATLAANSRAVVWQQPFRPKLHGVLLPSLQRFMVPLPDTIDLGATGVQSSIALSSTRLYVLDGEGQLWSTPAPHPAASATLIARRQRDAAQRAAPTSDTRSA
jgi:hypothetical protein